MSRRWAERSAARRACLDCRELLARSDSILASTPVVKCRPIPRSNPLAFKVDQHTNALGLHSYGFRSERRWRPGVPVPSAKLRPATAPAPPAAPAPRRGSAAPQGPTRTVPPAATSTAHGKNPHLLTHVRPRGRIAAYELFVSVDLRKLPIPRARFVGHRSRALLGSDSSWPVRGRAHLPARSPARRTAPNIPQSPSWPAGQHLVVSHGTKQKDSYDFPARPLTVAR
jgi:hypothetical protein